MKVLLALAFLVVAAAVPMPSTLIQPIKLPKAPTPFVSGAYEADHGPLVADIPKGNVFEPNILNHVKQAEFPTDSSSVSKDDHLDYKSRETVSVVDRQRIIVPPNVKAQLESMLQVKPLRSVEASNKGNVFEPNIQDHVKQAEFPTDSSSVSKDDHLEYKSGEPVSVVDRQRIIVPPNVKAQLESMLQVKPLRSVEASNKGNVFEPNILNHVKQAEFPTDSSSVSKDDHLEYKSGEPVSVVDRQRISVPPNVKAQLESMLQVKPLRSVEASNERVQVVKPDIELIRLSDQVQSGESLEKPIPGAPEWSEAENPMLRAMPGFV